MKNLNMQTIEILFVVSSFKNTSFHYNISISDAFEMYEIQL